MDKYEQLKKEFDLLQDSCKDWLDPDNPSEFEYYIETAMLRIWGANGKYSESFGKAIEAISGKSRTPVQITRAMLDSIEPAEMAKIPSFFARMVADDFQREGRNSKNFVRDLKSLLAGAAFINGDFTIEESNMLSAEMKRLMTYAISQGVKVDYAIGRIRDRITPLKEDSYVSADTQAQLSADIIFDALDRDFLMPGGKGRGRGGGDRRDGLFGNGIGGQGGSPEDLPSMDSIFKEDPAGTGRPDGGAPVGPDSAEGGPAKAAGGAYEIRSDVEIKEDPRTMEELMEELDALVGLDGIKEDIRSLMNFIQITKLRKERGLNVPTISYHLVFSGNPGTGKTTVARLVAGLYHRIGILPKGQLVETERAQLIAGYTGQTALKTMSVIEQAMGGVLFIDEAYSLVNDDQDSFGKEAVETILKAMEDHRDELVVIVAGYTELMHKFIESNPGFRSRFSKFFEFPDYTGEELLQIFTKFCEKNGYHMTEEAEAYLLLQFNDMYEHRDPHFGNGRTARNVFEKAIHQQANRLAGLVDDGAAGKTEPAADPGADETADPGADVTANPGADVTADSGAAPGAAATAGEVTDHQLQELTKEDLEAAVEAEKRKIEI